MPIAKSKTSTILAFVSMTISLMSVGISGVTCYTIYQTGKLLEQQRKESEELRELQRRLPIKSPFRSPIRPPFDSPVRVPF